jgi:hypothetical protein
VVTLRVPTAAIGSEQERSGLPSRNTVHAPHWATPQPYFVPVRCRLSRNTRSSGVLPSTSTWRAAPFTTIEYAMIPRAGDCLNTRGSQKIRDTHGNTQRAARDLRPQLEIFIARFNTRLRYSTSLGYMASSFLSTPLVQPKPSCSGYSPPPPAALPTTSYFSTSLPVALKTC